MKDPEQSLILIRGGGDLASGVALRLYRSGFGVVISEIAAPLSVRRLASFAEAVYETEWQVEGVPSILCANKTEIADAIACGKIAVAVDPEAKLRHGLAFDAVVDARMLKSTEADTFYPELFSIGLGPCFEAGINCNAVVETNRGANLGRVYWQGSAEADTGEPEWVGEFGNERVLRAPGDGVLRSGRRIGEIIEAGEVIGSVDGLTLAAPFKGVLRGLLRDGTQVQRGLKIGDLDPRCDPSICTMASDKALAVGGGVLEALLSRGKTRKSPGCEG